MSKWEVNILEDLVFVDKEQLNSSTESEFSFFYIDIGSVSTNQIQLPVSPIFFQGSPSRARKVLHDGDILMATVRPNLKAFAKFKKPANRNCIASTGFAVLSKKENTDINFIYYSLFSYEVEKQIEALVVGSNYPALNTSDIRKLKILTPSIPEQRQIATILSTADAVIEKTQAAIAKYKAIKQGMLQDLFTYGILTKDIKYKDKNGTWVERSRNQLRPSYQDAPELYKESKLGWIPKEWEEKPLEELTTQIGDGIHSTPKYSKNTDYYFINGNNLSDGEIEIGSSLCVIEEEYKKHFKELNNRTILYSINGTIGNMAIYKNEKVILGKSACYITCKSSVNLDYLFFILQTFSIKRFYELEMTGSTIKNLSLASVRNTPIAIPKDDKEQEIIAERIRTINNKLQTEQAFLHKQQQIKAGLMGDLLSGRKKVSIKEKLLNQVQEN